MAGERPSFEGTKVALEALQRQLNAVIHAGEDADGRLTEAQVKLAERALAEINAIQTLIRCPQQMSPYRR